MARKYQLKQRAARQNETRQRIIDAAVELHTTIGVAHTTLSAVAARAGVERLTLYRHFPTEHELFVACANHYLVTHPLPDPTPWALVADPLVRLRRALAEVYAYYHITEESWVHIPHDGQAHPDLAEFVAPYVERWGKMQAALGVGWEAPQEKSKLLEAALGHALDFQTWYSLVRQQELADEQAIELLVGMICCLMGSP
jgi:AcrR family transcriptional regulator